MKTAFVLIALFLAIQAGATGFGSKEGQEPANLDEISQQLRADQHDLELLISYGTSKGGSAGHLALAIRDVIPDDDLVYSANYYADRSKKHAQGFYTDALVMRIPKKEYLFKTTSSLGETASFGLDFGEVYKRSVIGVRVSGVSATERAVLADYFARINDDYLQRRRNTEYHDGEIRYGYLDLNCAKTIASAFKFGAGYASLPIDSPRILGRSTLVAAVNANTPTEMAMALMKEWAARGYTMDVVLYRKYAASDYIDPHDDKPVAFRDLPDRFPSVLSRDFRREKGEYKDADNLYAMYLFYNLARYSVQINPENGLLEIAGTRQPASFAEADRSARQNARSDSRNYRSHRPFAPQGVRIGGGVNSPEATGATR